VVEANAALIAAAPLMLHACRELLKAIDFWHSYDYLRGIEPHESDIVVKARELVSRFVG
jgi:hypothetical protein